MKDRQQDYLSYETMNSADNARKYVDPPGKSSAKAYVKSSKLCDD